MVQISVINREGVHGATSDMGSLTVSTNRTKRSQPLTLPRSVYLSETEGIHLCQQDLSMRIICPIPVKAHLLEYQQVPRVSEAGKPEESHWGVGMCVGDTGRGHDGGTGILPFSNRYFRLPQVS